MNLAGVTGLCSKLRFHDTALSDRVLIVTPTSALSISEEEKGYSSLYIVQRRRGGPWIEEDKSKYLI